MMLVFFCHPSALEPGFAGQQITQALGFSLPQAYNQPLVDEEWTEVAYVGNTMYAETGAQTGTSDGGRVVYKTNHRQRMCRRAVVAVPRLVCQRDTHQYLSGRKRQSSVRGRCPSVYPAISRVR
jgi:hypothetical protein